MTNKQRILLSFLILSIAVAFIVVGILRDEVSLIFNKAINICMECVGIG